jgi:hypothetical protein
LYGLIKNHLRNYTIYKYMILSKTLDTNLLQDYQATLQVWIKVFSIIVKKLHLSKLKYTKL